MNRCIATALLFASFITPEYAGGCELGEPRSFESALADSKNVFIVRVISTAAPDSGSGAPVMERAVAKVRIVKTYAGRPKLAHISYDIDWCGGTSLEAGHYYLIATDNNERSLWLASDSDYGILDISHSYGLYSTRNPIGFDVLSKGLESRPKKLKDGSFDRLGNRPSMR